MERVPTPEDVVGLIKAIVNLDRRERHAAGYKFGTYMLAHRIAAELGLKLETVRKIKERKRHKHVFAARLMQCTTTRDEEVLEEIRQHRIRRGRVAASWRGDRPYLLGGRWFRKKRLAKLREPG